ncbi:PAS domain-containing protein [Aquicoccus sp. SCR17]|nr:PAS domain-containing protein [Carideicomes alvinocaridis]
MARKPANSGALTAGLNLIQQALTIYDSDLRLVLCNRRFQEMFGLPDRLCTPGARFEDTIRHQAVTGDYGDVDPEEFVAARVRQALAFEPHYMERARANGQMISVEGAPLPQGGWVTVYTDITQTKRQEALLRARSEELSGKVLSHAEELAATNRKLASTVAALEEAKREITEMEARTRLTTEMMPAHISHVNGDRRYSYSNRKLGQVMPGRPTDVLGRHIAEVLGAPTYAVIEPYLNRAFKGEPSVFEFTDALSARRIRAAFTPDRDEDGEIGGVYILSMDVTEESQARAALQQTRRREIAAQLTSGMAHDFSNLLTIILGTQTRLQKMDLPPEARDLISATLQAAHRGGALLNQIADMTGRREPRPEPTRIAPFLHGLVQLASPSLPEGVRLEIRDGTPDQSLMLDRGMLQDSLLNLVLNARDSCGGRGRIVISVHTVSETWVEFTVTDSGPGFSQAALAHAFDPFFTTKGDHGTGLGLAMVYDMTKLAGGEVRLSNGYMGARVTLRLPYRPAVENCAPGLVLLVEDSPDLREGLRDMLTGMGHSVVEAASVPEALALAEGLPELTLILSDIQLEGEATGLDLIDRLAATGRAAPPVFLMSSLPQGDPLRDRAAERAPLLPKPFTSEMLADFLQPGLRPSPRPEAAE